MPKVTPPSRLSETAAVCGCRAAGVAQRACVSSKMVAGDTTVDGAAAGAWLVEGLACVACVECVCVCVLARRRVPKPSAGSGTKRQTRNAAALLLPPSTAGRKKCLPRSETPPLPDSSTGRAAGSTEVMSPCCDVLYGVIEGPASDQYWPPSCVARTRATPHQWLGARHSISEAEMKVAATLSCAP